MAKILFYIPSQAYLPYLNDLSVSKDDELIVLSEIKIDIEDMSNGNLHVIYTASVFSNDELNRIIRKGIEVLHQWAGTKPAGSESSLVQRWMYENFSLWWVSGYLYFYNEFLHVVKTCELINRVLRSEHIDKVVIFKLATNHLLASAFVSKDEQFQNILLKQFTKIYGLSEIELKLSKKHSRNIRKNKRMDQVKTFLLTHFYEPLNLLLRRRVGRLSPVMTDHADCIVVSPSPNLGKIYHLHDGREIFGDSKLGYLFQYIKDNDSMTLLGVDANSIPDLNIHQLKQRILNDLALSWRGVETFLGIGDFLNSKKLKARLKLSAREIDSCLSSLYYNDIYLGKILKPRFELINQAFLFSGILKFKGFCKLIDKMKPKIVLLTYETGLHGRAATAAAHLKQIPVVGVQHGKIHASHAQYVVPGVNNLHALNPLYPPTVDKLAVFGPATRQILTRENGYTDNIPVETGQIASDALASAEKIYSKKRFLKEVKWDGQRPIVLILSQNLETQAEYDYFYDVILSESGHLDCYFMVKLHPRENFGQLREMIHVHADRNYNIKIFQNKDLYELIFYSDVVVTGNSTTGMDALALGKPLITVEGFKYGVGYSEAGASIGVRNPKEFVAALNRITKHEEEKSELLRRGEDFLLRSRLKPDGKAAQRVHHILTSLLGQNR